MSGVLVAEKSGEGGTADVVSAMRNRRFFTYRTLFIVAIHASAANAEPLVIGDTFKIESKAVGETRRINVYLPPGYTEGGDNRFPVLYMPDGATAEDFLHVAGLVQVGVGNGTMRRFVLVGIENTSGAAT